MRVFVSLLSSLFFFLSSSFVQGVDKELSVVVIGGGPAGLATAIEAKEKGASVSIIEQRSSYTRQQLLFLFEPSLALLAKWQIKMPSMVVSTLENHQRVGIIEIKELENALANRARELNIPRIQAQFAEIHAPFIEIDGETETIKIPYDILVGADGLHSQVREKIGIPIVSYGFSNASTAFIPLPYLPEKIKIPAAEIHQDLFIKRLLIPSARIIMIQTSKDSSHLADNIGSPKVYEEIARECGWLEEADLIASGNSVIMGPISVMLQQATTFSDPFKSIILVGDAAATAPFFEAGGANFAFQAASIAGSFIDEIRQKNVTAYQEFNDAMHRAADELIQASQYLMQ